MKKDTRYSIRKLSVGVASIAVASFLAGGSADAANLSPLYSKQVNPELPFEPFPSEIEYTQAETPWTPQESAEAETPVEESPVESPEFTKAEAPFADRVVEVEEDPEFTEAEAPFANRDEEVSEPSEANYENPEAPFAPVEEEVSEPSEANFVNPEDPFAEGVPANGENPAAPYSEGVSSNQVNPEAPFAPAQELGEEEPVEEEVSEPTEANFVNPENPFAEGVPANGENPAAPYSEGVPSNQVNPEAPFAPAQELGEEEPVEEEPVEETEAPDLTELTPAEELIDLVKPSPLKFQEVEDGTIISAIDYVTNKDEFPEGTEFNFIDYKTRELAATKELLVAPNPKTRNQRLVIRASHPDAVEAMDSPSFTVVVKKTPEAPDLTELTPAEELIDLVKPSPLKFQEVEDGTIISAIDYVTNKDEFPEGTEFNFIDYKTRELAATKELLVAPNPKTRNQRLVIRASHPDAVEAMDSPSFTVVVKKTPEAPDLTELTPAEEIIGDLTPLEPAEEVVGDLTPLEPAVEVETKTITRKEEETLPSLEKEDPELLEGKNRVEEGSPKVTEIIEEVTYEDGKEVSRKELSRKVIKEGNPEIKYTGTKPAVVTEVKEETRTVEETLPVIEKEDPDLLEGDSRVEEGTPKVTEITEKVTYEDGKEVSRKEVSRKVINQGTPEIKYTGTKPAVVTEIKEETRTVEETLPVIEKEDPDLLEGDSRVEVGTPKVIQVTDKVTYEDGEEVSREEVSRIVIKEGSPEIKYTGTKVEWTVQYDAPGFVPSEEALKIVKDTRGTFKAEVDQISELFETGLQMLIWRSPSQSSKDFYQKVLDASQADEGQTVIADFLDYYRKSKDDTSLTLEDLVMDSAGKTGGIYETMILAAADKLGVDSIESGQTPEAYKELMGDYMLRPSDGSNIYKDVMKNDDFGAYAPRKEAVDDVNKTYANVKSLISAGHSAFRQITKDYSLTEEDTLAASLDYYRALTKQPEASLKDVIVDLANYSFDLPGAIKMVQHYDPSVKGLPDVVANYKRVMTTKPTKQGRADRSVLDFFAKEVQTIIDGLGIDLTNV